ncbi:Polysaccharide deacetylase [Mesorhizobium albiziae]|uniref:Chitooligosaccharide deacetylase n=1 Tax=Neomesorhizobium albiziae TaxID=335020 RepID=A0A1I3YYK3_9HYPH|nr:polysaccharide deacetylase family protein [Mesorhizobium albiziae]GLS33187.1 polysaccharide deacetylase [Mesorhizobium albiziae]SFK36918.1 Polysaccharide deacetylase [Mesorhizobium albiziae]
MSESQIWQPLLYELARWERAGRKADFWLRDDDAVEPTTALDRLLALTEKYGVPATLAVIPAFTGADLVERLADAPHVTVAVHGWSHENHAAAGEKKQELGRHRDRDIVLDELSQGLAHMGRLHGPRLVPLLVAPWNRIDSALIAGLVPIGFEALSVFGASKPAALQMVNSNVDLMDWHGTGGCRDHGALVGDIVAQLSRSLDGGDAVGILTHHLVHDEAAWLFLARLFEITVGHSSCRWRGVRELIARTR